MTLKVYGITPAWGLPCVSPFVTKLVYGLRLAGVPFDLVPQDPSTLAADSPNGKLPYAVWPDGTRLADSSALLLRLVPEPPMPPAHHALCLLVQRLVDEHLYWHGVVEPRWVPDDAWLRYRPVLFGVADLPPPLSSWADAVRAHVLHQWRGCGLGMLPAERRADRAREDVRALAALLGSAGPGLCGDQAGHADVALAAMTAHLLEAPFDSAAAEEAGRHPALARHLTWLRQRMSAAG
jgi:glutathione S-transferase